MAGQRQKGGPGRPVCMNRRARHEYEILDTVEAGLVLTGSEVKSLRDGQGQLADAFASLTAEGVVLRNFEIPAYRHDHSGATQARRTRRLLLRGAEIRKLQSQLREQGLALVPLSVYFSGPWAKVELAVARGRRKADKRQALRTREAQRDMDRAYRRR